MEKRGVRVTFCCIMPQKDLRAELSINSCKARQKNLISFALEWGQSSFRILALERQFWGPGLRLGSGVGGGSMNQGEFHSPHVL